MKRKPNYGIDSPAIVATLCVLALASLLAGLRAHTAWRCVGYGLGAYFFLGAVGFLFYSKVGKLGLRERLLDKIPWRGDERVLDVGCGRGLLTVGAAHRVPNGFVVGVDVWNPRAISGNRAESVLENATAEGVGNRVEAKEGDARKLPFDDGSFDVVVSNFVVHRTASPGRPRTDDARSGASLETGRACGARGFHFHGRVRGGPAEARSRRRANPRWIPFLLDFSDFELWSGENVSRCGKEELGKRSFMLFWRSSRNSLKPLQFARPIPCRRKNA